MKVLSALVAAAVAAVVTLGPAPAGATDEATVASTIVSTPDNGCPAWARDTLTRTTTVTDTADGLVVSFHDDGTFATADGEQGSIVGDVTFAPAAGDLRDLLPDGDTVDNSGYQCKSDVPADGSTVSSWPTRYVTGDAPAIVSWSWTYTLCGESFTEEDGTVEVGREQFPAADSADCQPPVPPTTEPPTTEPAATDTPTVEPVSPAPAAPVAPAASPVVAQPAFTG